MNLRLMISPVYFSSSSAMVLGLNLSSWAALGASALGAGAVACFLDGSGPGEAPARPSSAVGDRGLRLGLLRLRPGPRRLSGPGLEEGDDELVLHRIQGVGAGLLQVEDHPGDGPGIGGLELADADLVDAQLGDGVDGRGPGERRVEKVDDEAGGIVEGEDLGNGVRAEPGLEADAVGLLRDVQLAQDDVARTASGSSRARVSGSMTYSPGSSGCR